MKKLRIPKLSPVITASLLAMSLALNVFAVFKWVGDLTVVGYAASWHAAMFVAVIAAVRTLQSGDRLFAAGHMAAVFLIAYFAKMLAVTMSGPAWQPLLYSTNLIVCLILSASFITTLTAKGSSKVHDGIFDEDYQRRSRKSSTSGKNWFSGRGSGKPKSEPEYEPASGYRPPN